MPKVASEFDNRSIRERLADWVSPNDQIQHIVPDMSFYSKVINSNTRSHATGSSELDNFKSNDEGGSETDGGAFHQDVEYSVIGSRSQSPGDLVEIKLVFPRSWLRVELTLS